MDSNEAITFDSSSFERRSSCVVGADKMQLTPVYVLLTGRVGRKGVVGRYTSPLVCSYGAYGHQIPCPLAYIRIHTRGQRVHMVESQNHKTSIISSFIIIVIMGGMTGQVIANTTPTDNASAGRRRARAAAQRRARRMVHLRLRAGLAFGGDI